MDPPNDPASRRAVIVASVASPPSRPCTETINADLLAFFKA
jgi:hypothetical protein